MSLHETLHRASLDVECGDLGKARDRLEGLLRAYPDSLEIRRRLGDVYWRLQYPERAGLHWYLLPADSPEMDTAKEAFSRRHRGDPWLMLDAIRYHGGLESVRGTYAEEALLDLAKRAHVSKSKLERSLRKREPGHENDSRSEPWWGRPAMAGCLLAVIAIAVLAFVGLYALMNGLL